MPAPTALAHWIMVVGTEIVTHCLAVDRPRTKLQYKVEHIRLKTVHYYSNVAETIYNTFLHHLN